MYWGVCCNITPHSFLSAKVKKVLRQQQVKPHWMFALDNLLRQAVHDAITVLMPGGASSEAALFYVSWFFKINFISWFSWQRWSFSSSPHLRWRTVFQKNSPPALTHQLLLLPLTSWWRQEMASRWGPFRRMYAAPTTPSMPSLTPAAPSVRPWGTYGWRLWGTLHRFF